MLPGTGRRRETEDVTDAVRGPAWQWDPSLFAGCARFYVRGRVAYPSALADLLVDVLNLDGRGRLLDVGCGPGSFTLLLASHFEEAVGVDADEQMLAEAERQAVAAGITNIEWVHGKGEDISPDMGHFRVASMAASFHWMDRERVAGLLRQRLVDDGVVAYVRATMHVASTGRHRCHIRERLEQQIDALVAEFLGEGAGPASDTASWIPRMSMHRRTPGSSGQRASPDPRGARYPVGSWIATPKRW